MKKIILAAMLPAALVMSGCSTFSGDMWSNETTWGSGEQHLQPNQYVAHDGSVKTYVQPRQYHVTHQDEQKYDAINDRISKRKAQIQQNYAQPTIDSNNPAPTQSSRSGSIGTHYDASSETNY